MTHTLLLPLAVSPELGGDDEADEDQREPEPRDGHEELGIPDEPELDVEICPDDADDREPDHLDIGELVDDDDERVGDSVLGLRGEVEDEEEALDSFSDSPGTPGGSSGATSLEQREGDSWDPIGADEAPDEDPVSTADDRGAEGTGEDAAQFVDEQGLPELDLGGDGDLDMSDLLREVELGGDEDWEIYGGFTVEAEVSSVDCREGRVIAAGDALVSVGRGDATARARPLAQRAIAAALFSTGAALATAEGVRVTSGTFEGARAVWDRVGVEQLGSASDRIFALSERQLWQVEPTLGAAVVIRQEVAGFAAAAGTLLAVVRQGTGHGLVRLRGHDGGWEELGDANDLGARMERGARLVANGGLSVAVLDRGRLLVGRGGRPHLRPIDLAPPADSHGESRSLSSESSGEPSAFAVCAAFQGDAAEAALLVIVRDSVASRLLRVGHADGHTVELCRLPWSDPRGVAWDATREIAFIVAESGLHAVGPRVSH